MSALNLTLPDWLSLIWFFICWVGYTRFSGFRHSKTRRLQDALYEHIRNWISVVQTRENHMVDTAVITNIERSSTFLASSSLLIIAGLATALGSGDKANLFLSGLPLATPVNPHRWEVGVILLIITFIYAFFTFTWCMRQWGFASILIGSTPDRDDTTSPPADRSHQQEALSKVVWLAIYHFNTGLRAYYFSLALLAWFIHPYAFMAASSWVVAVLYRREFRSRTLHALNTGLNTPMK